MNDKPTGAVVGQQPFGGGGASGTNDKAGSMWNLIRWVSPRTDEGDLRAADRLPLPLYGAGRLVRRFFELAEIRLDVLDEVGDEVDVPGVLVEVVRDEVQLHDGQATPAT